jgi:hypothetical protein
VVETYESELVRLRHEASEAHAMARQELMRRKQLEEDMRRMILKNMTAMNFEALQLFQNTTAPGQAEQQQQFGELSALVATDEDEMVPRRVPPTPTAPRGPLVDATNGKAGGAGTGSVLKAFPAMDAKSTAKRPGTAALR